MFERIEFLCNEREITLYRLAKETGISTASLTMWKKGEYNPSITNLKKLSDYFKVPLDYFIEK